MLGSFDVRRDGVSVELGGPQPRTLLAHLALEAGRVVSVDRLIERLWGEEPPATALGTLQSYVSRLRRGLEPDRAPGAPATVLASEAPGYVLRVDRQQVDVFRFDDLAEAGRELAAAGRFDAAIERFDAALALWRGPALGGVGEDSLLPTIIRLEEDRLHVVEDRCDALLALGRHAEVVGDLQQAVVEHPLRERLWGQLALALYRSRRQADALRAIAAARSTLAEELGLDPGPELRRLESQILDHDPALLAVPAPIAPTRVAVDAPAPAPDVSPLIGRDGEWATLLEARTRALAGEPSVVLIEGEPGIGKSTLLDAVATRASADGWVVFRSQCVEEGLAPALWPWLEGLRSLRDDPRTPPEHQERAAAILGTIAEDDTAMTLIEIANGVAAALQSFAAERPLLVAVEDLHWADGASLEMLPLLMSRLGGSHVLILGTMRPLDLGAGGPLSTALGAIGRVAGTTRLILDGLDVEASAQLYEAVSGTTPDTDSAAQLHTRTAGNSLFITELARLGSVKGAGADVPDAVRDVVRRRLARLPGPTGDLLVTAAVLGQDVDLDVLANVASISIDRCLDDLDPAVVTRILVPSPTGRYRFSHALVRDAVLADLSPLRLARLHLRAADAIESLAGHDPDRHEPIAMHRWHALAVDDPVRVGEALVRAADTARRRGAFDRPKELLDWAFAALRRAPASERRADAEMGAAESLATLATIESNLMPRHEVSAIVDDVADRSDSDIARVLALFMRWSELTTAADPSMLQLLRRVGALVERSTVPYVQVMGHYLIGAQAMVNGDLAAAEHHLMVAVEQCRLIAASEGALRAAPVDVGGIARLVLAARGASDDTIDAVRDTEIPGSWMGDRHDPDKIELHHAFMGAMIAAFQGRPEQVPAHVVTVARDSFAAHVEPFWSTCVLLQEWAAACAGEPVDRDRARRAVESIAAAVDSTREIIPTHYSFCGDALRLAGDLDGAREMFEIGIEMAERTLETWWLPELLRLRAATRLASGDTTAAARADLERAVSLAESQSSPMLLARATADLAALDGS